MDEDESKFSKKIIMTDDNDFPIATNNSLILLFVYKCKWYVFFENATAPQLSYYVIFWAEFGAWKISVFSRTQC